MYVILSQGVSGLVDGLYFKRRVSVSLICVKTVVHFLSIEFSLCLSWLAVVQEAVQSDRVLWSRRVPRQ